MNDTIIYDLRPLSLSLSLSTFSLRNGSRTLPRIGAFAYRTRFGHDIHRHLFVTQQCQDYCKQTTQGVRAIQSPVINNSNNEEVIVKTINKRRVKLQLIIDPSSRKATYKKRRGGLLKKIEQLCILCGIQACIVIFGPGDTKPTVWPSVEEASKIVQKFEEIPEMERFNRTISHREYRQQRII
ncbi:hypothetical protein PIB30_059059 [Stylosanthes scabra]|uniref:MADS-box domain-containing protein n=1 Tax=Stylosanthes scabra TaxID=79078 RepID=A0ABU6RK50_9FABA|nr:hypothetical protein [Stylosanthes scabra]